MRRILSALALTTTLGGAFQAPAQAASEVSFNLSIGENDGYYMGLGNYYGVPHDRVSLLVDYGLAYDDVSVVLYIADAADVDPFIIADMRMNGMSWMAISHYYGLGADAYYVTDVQPYGPYVSYFEPFYSHPRSSWVSLRLSDVAIVNLVNLRFAYQHYNVSPRYVMEWRHRGDNFRHINYRLWRERGRMPRRPLARHAVRHQALPERYRAEARKHRAVSIVQPENTRIERRWNKKQAENRQDARVINRQQRIETQRAEQRREATRQTKLDQKRDAQRAEERRRDAQRTEDRKQAQRAQQRRETQQAEQRREARRKEARQEVRKTEQRREAQKAEQRRNTQRREAQKAEQRRESRRTEARQNDTRNTQRNQRQEAQQRKNRQEQAQKPQGKKAQGKKNDDRRRGNN